MSSPVKSDNWVRSCTLVYALLIALTLVTWAVGSSGASGTSISLIVLALAMLKGHMIGDWFMGLRGLTSFWRWVVVIWLFIPGALITWAFV